MGGGGEGEENGVGGGGEGEENGINGAEVQAETEELIEGLYKVRGCASGEQTHAYVTNMYCRLEKRLMRGIAAWGHGLKPRSQR